MEDTATDRVGGATAALVRAVQAGDSSAFAALVARFEQVVHRTALRITHNPTDAEDVAQQTWLRLLTSIHQLQQPECLPGWLSTTAHREAFRVLRERGRTESLDGVLLAVVPDPAPGPEAAVERRDADHRVRAALSRLPPEKSRLLLDLVCEERPYRDVSAESGRPIGSLGPMRSRCLRQLRTELDRDDAVVA